jgi:hypothetical protein
MVKIAKEYLPKVSKNFICLLHIISVKKLKTIMISCSIKLKVLSMIFGKIAEANEKSEPYAR